MASTALETRHAIQKYIVGSGEHARASARRQGNGMALRSNDRRPQKDATSMFAKLCGYKKKLGLLYGYGSIPINTIFSGMNFHLPAILMFTRGTGFWPIPTFQFRDLPEKNMISRGFPSLGALAKLLVSMMCFAPRRSWWWKIADADR